MKQYQQIQYLVTGIFKYVLERVQIKIEKIPVLLNNITKTEVRNIILNK